MKPLKPIISPKIYFPGLISLVFLPLLCISYLFVKGRFTQLCQMRVEYYNKALIDKLSKEQHKAPVYPDAFRHYKKVVMSGNAEQNETYLKSISKQLKIMGTKADTVNGYQIQFSDNTKYADVVKTLDVFEQDHDNYIIYNGDVYIFWVRPWATKVTRSIDNMGLLFDDIVIAKPPPTFFEKLSVEFNENLKPFWPCLIPFAGMIYFWRKRNKWDVEAGSKNYHGNL